MFKLGISRSSDSQSLCSLRLSVGVKEAAFLLGISERSLWSLTKSGAVRSKKIGRRVVYRISWLLEYLEQR